MKIGDRKYIHTPGNNKAEMYDLSTDPGELVNLITRENAASYAHYRKKVNQWFEGTKGELGKESLSDEDREKLKSLGYGN